MITNGRIPLRDIQHEAALLLEVAMGNEYAAKLVTTVSTDDPYQDEYNAFVHELRNDVEESSAWNDNGVYNLDDVRLAIGRVLLRKFKIDA